MAALTLVAGVAWVCMRPVFVFETRIWEGAREELQGTLEQVAHVGRLAPALQRVEPAPELHGLQLGEEGPVPALLALRLELALRSGSWSHTPLSSSGAATGPVLLYLEGTSEWLTLVAQADVRGRLLSSGSRHTLWQLSGPAGLERITRRACEAASGRVVLRHRRNGVGASTACPAVSHSGPE